MIIFRILSTIIFILILPFIYVARAIKGKFIYGWKEKFGIFCPPELEGNVIMFHGVSVGEVIALENLIKKTKEIFPEVKIVVTTGTKTGQDIARKKYTDIADFITYFPFDVPFCVSKFLDKINPKIVFIAETEIWPNFASLCASRGIKLYIINGRISDSTYNLYKTARLFFKYILKFYTGIYTQSEIDNNKMLYLGSNPETTKVMGNLKFDIKKVESDFNLAQNDYRVILAGSTHHEENEIILRSFKNLKKKFSDIKLLIAPRHMNRVEQIKEISKKLELKYGLRSNDDKFTDFDVIILDTLGELSKIYTICHFAFIGGSFNKTGGHNPLEATVFGKPTITGPSIHNFRDIYGLLDRCDAGKIVKTPDELETYMQKLLYDEEFYQKACKDCYTVFEDQKGALDFVIEIIKNNL